ncbi:MAG: Rsd/AlgQ family anti-sigma factor [Methylobacter sp.]|nr:Rsd/AlgQ family anti-sigma factor [Methylobacter sp.]
MSIAVQINPEKKQQAEQLIAELQNERQQVWSLYCHVAELIPFSANQTVRNKLARFSEMLIDYVSLGHFGVCESLFSGSDNEDSALSAAREIYPELSSTTQAAVAFNDKYEHGATTVLDELKQDLSELGENLAKRIDLEDRLCELMLQ